MQALYYFRDYSPPASSNLMDNSPIWMLGMQHECTDSNESQAEASISNRKDFFPSFVADFDTRIWCTYRKDFPTIPTSYYTSDMGWGCMHRTGQMALAQAFLTHYLGRDWRREGQDLPRKYYEILQLFADKEEAPFSIHNISSIGAIQSKAVGEWYGPSTLAHALKELIQQYLAEEFSVYVSENGMIYEDEVNFLCGAEDGGDWKQSLIIFVPLRLGVDGIPPVYHKTIPPLFQYSQSLGMAGGKPRSSLYFVAVQGDSLFYLDPHVVFSKVDMDNIPFDATTYQPKAMQNIKISDIDPSFSATFYCRNRADFEDFCAHTHRLHEEMDGDHLFAIESTRVKKGEPVEVDISWPEDGDFSLLMDDDPELEDFVIL